MDMKIVVIGSISAGVSAARRVSAGDPNPQITVYERGAFYSCGAWGLPYYLTQSMAQLKSAIDGKEAELAAQRVEARLNHEAVEIDPARRQVTIRDLASGQSVTEGYDKLVLATGSRTCIPQVPGNDRVGVQTLRNVEDLLFLKEYTRTPYVRDIVVLGTSYDALETAKAFQKLGRNVRVISAERRLLPDFDPEVSSLIQKELEAEGIQFSLGETVAEFPGRTYIEKVRTNRGSYDCDLCVCAAGNIPNADLAVRAGAAVDSRGAVQINSNLETSVPGIYAVGDCAVCCDAVLRTTGLHAAELEVARTGLTEEEAKKAGLRVRSALARANDRPGICPNPNQVSIKLVYDAATRRVVGAQAWGAKNAATRINAIAVAITGGMTVEQLGNVEFFYSSPASSIWDPIQIVCAQAK